MVRPFHERAIRLFITDSRFGPYHPQFLVAREPIQSYLRTHPKTLFLRTSLLTNSCSRPYHENKPQWAQRLLCVLHRRPGGCALVSEETSRPRRAIVFDSLPVIHLSLQVLSTARTIGRTFIYFTHSSRTTALLCPALPCLVLVLLVLVLHSRAKQASMGTLVYHYAANTSASTRSHNMLIPSLTAPPSLTPPPCSLPAISIPPPKTTLSACACACAYACACAAAEEWPLMPPSRDQQLPPPLDKQDSGVDVGVDSMASPTATKTKTNGPRRKMRELCEGRRAREFYR